MPKVRKVRIRGGFSDRTGLNPISADEQLTDFSKETRNILFNCFRHIVESDMKNFDLSTEMIARDIVENLFADIYLPNDDEINSVLTQLLYIFQKEPYDEVLTTIEFLSNLFFSYEKDALENGYFYRGPNYPNPFEKFDKAFQSENVGYRFVDRKIIQVTNEDEIEEINTACTSSYKRISESIRKAVSFLSETGNKDFKNSIKESITALEQLFNILLDTNGLCLSNAVDQYSRKYPINEHLLNSIKHLYKFASDTNGVRHGNNKDNGDVSFEEAKFVLIVCSAITNLFSLINLEN